MKVSTALLFGVSGGSLRIIATDNTEQRRLNCALSIVNGKRLLRFEGVVQLSFRKDFCIDLRVLSLSLSTPLAYSLSGALRCAFLFARTNERKKKRTNERTIFE